MASTRPGFSQRNSPHQSSGATSAAPGGTAAGVIGNPRRASLDDQARAIRNVAFSNVKVRTAVAPTTRTPV